MISSCKDCKSKCCRTGPGPWKPVPAYDYLDSFGNPEAYNTKCENFKGGKCSVWKTKDFPTECLTYVCQSRKFTKEELARINSVEDFDACDKCGTEHHYTTYTYKGGRTYMECPTCGHKWTWFRSVAV